MKKILRLLTIIFVLLIFWPFFLYKHYGNSKQELKDRTIIITNHYSNFDPFLIYRLFLRKNVIFACNSEAKKRLFPRYFAWLFNCVFIDYSSINLKYVKECVRILSNNGIICIFPEGIINPQRDGFYDFYKSYILIAKKAHANILPIYLYPSLTPFRFSKIFIGKTITFDEYKLYEDNEELNMHILSLIMEYSNKLITINKS